MFPVNFAHRVSQLSKWTKEWAGDWVSRQVWTFCSSISLISSITHSIWCSWHFHGKSFCHLTSAPVPKCWNAPSATGGVEGGVKQEQSGRGKCAFVKGNEPSPDQEGVQCTITHSNRFLWVGCQGTGFLSHICSEENRKNQMRKSSNRLRARMPLIRNRVLSASTLAAGAVASSSLLFLMRKLSDSLKKLIRFFFT